MTRNEHIRATVAAGEPAIRVAERFGISRQRIDQILHPEKRRAREAVTRALRSGKIQRSHHCQRCHRRRRTTAHHADYSKPLDVEWLCPACHDGEHTEQRRAILARHGMRFSLL